MEALFSGTWGVCRGLLNLNLKTVRATAWSSFNVATSEFGSIGSGVGRCFQGDSIFDSNMDTRVSLKLGGYITI